MAPTKRRSSPGPSSSQPKKSVAFGEGSRPSAAGGPSANLNDDGMGEIDGVEDDESSEGEVVDDDEEDSSDGDEDRKSQLSTTDGRD